jgi:hypothetical protein
MIEDEKKEQDNEKINAELAQCYKRMALTDDGKKIIADLAKECRFKSTSIDNTWNVNRTFFNEGKRDVYFHIMNKIERKERKDG